MTPNPNNYKSYQAGRFDSSKSLYRHEIHFLPTQKAEKLQGYSANAAEDKEEAIDKNYVLMSQWYRLLPKYFDKMTCIEVFRRNDLRFAWSESNETPLFTILEHDVIFHTSDLPEYVQDFLKKLLKRLNEGECIANLCPRVKRPKSKEDYYKKLLMSSRSFTTIEALEKFCGEKIATGGAKGMVEDFERKYKEQYFSEHQPTQKPESYDEFLKQQKFETETALVDFCKKEIQKESVSREVLGKFWRQYRDSHFPESIPKQQETPKVQHEPSTVEEVQPDEPQQKALPTQETQDFWAQPKRKRERPKSVGKSLPEIKTRLEREAKEKQEFLQWLVDCPETEAQKLHHYRVKFPKHKIDLEGLRAVLKRFVIAQNEKEGGNE